MLYTLADGRVAVKQFVDSGSCNTITIDRRINEALERLMDNEDWECLNKFLRICVKNRCFSLPYNVEKILWANVNGVPGKVFGTAYQFLSSGPGEIDNFCGSSAFKDIADLGDDYPVFFDVPKCYNLDAETTVYPEEGMKLLAFSTESSDTNKVLRVRGYGFRGVEVEPGLNPGEDVPIKQWLDGVEGQLQGQFTGALEPSVNKFKDITRILKPVTAGYVTLYAVDPDNNFFYFLGKFHPTETIPQYRRYRITNQSKECCDSVLTRVKMRYVPLTHADDVLPLDSLQALKLMVMAISQENAGNLQGAVSYISMAKQVMQEREGSRTMTTGTPMVLDSDYRASLGRALNRGVIL